jgi:alpha-beta hydrolase superfamily lysophospholipase
MFFLSSRGYRCIAHDRRGHRRSIFSRFEKLDVLFLAFLQFALIIEALRLV